MKAPKRNPDLKKVLFEPVAPYFADAYNTLTSVVQALALGILGYEITVLFFEGQSQTMKVDVFLTDATPKIIVSFLIVSVLWHRYIMHDQFYAWKLGVFDTVIPVGFGLLQVLLILSISKGFIYFSFWFAWISTWGIFAYLNTNYHHTSPPENPTARMLYREHFSSLGSDFADAFFAEVARYEKKALMELILSSIVLWILHCLVFWNVWSELPRKILYFTVSLSMLVWLLYFSLWRHLNDSRRLEDFWVRLEKPIGSS